MSLQDGNNTNTAAVINENLTVVSLNMAKEARLDRILAGIRRAAFYETADIWLLQEARPNVSEMADALGMHYIYAPADQFGNGSVSGLAILSRYPFERSNRTVLPRHNLRFNTRCRIALTAAIRRPSGEIRLVNVHLDTRITQPQRLQQVGSVVEKETSSSEPVIVGGDFNTANVRWMWNVFPVPYVAAAYTSHWGTALSTLVVAIVTYLVTPPTVSPTYGLDSTTPLRSDEFLATITGATGVPFIEGHRITFLNNGDEFYPAMLKAIRQARSSITIEAYIYWAGSIGRQFADAIAERALAGVDVKILLDAVGSSTIGSEILKTLRDSGCQVRWYNMMFWRTIGRFNNRTHRKSLIIDGSVAFTGGAGIADHWLGNAQDLKHWRDVQIRLEGPGAVPLQTGFVQNWLATTGELVTGPRYFPKAEPVGPIAVQTIMSSPAGGSSAVRTMYYLSIVFAQRKLYIANAYFIPDESGVDILISARKRGVDVKLMLSGIHNDMKLARYGGMQLYGKLLEAGVEIYEYNRTMLHQKTMVVDGAWITVGTTNFDNRSFALHEESNICIYDTRLAERLEQIFFEDLAGCVRVDLESWKRRGMLTKIRGVAALFLKDQL